MPLRNARVQPQRGIRTQKWPWYLRGWYCPHQYPTPTNGPDQTTLRTGSAVPRQPLRGTDLHPLLTSNSLSPPYSPAWRLSFQRRGGRITPLSNVLTATLSPRLADPHPAPRCATVHHRAQAFEVIDTNNDGFITKEDLKVILASLCKRSPRMASRTLRLPPVPHAASRCG